MKNEIETNCEYLLPMSLEQRKKGLFTNQLNRHRQAKRPLPPRYCHTEIDNCTFGLPPQQEEGKAGAGVGAGERKG